MLISNGKLIADIPWEAALSIVAGLQSCAKKAEEYAKANVIIHDHAILTRAGVPMGLSDHPKIQEEVKKEAAWNRDLRRFMPGGVKSKVVFGTPAITQGAPK